MPVYTCQQCETEFEHPYHKKTCSSECANRARSEKTEQQWEEQGDEMQSAVKEAMRDPEMREYMRETQLGDENSMAGKTGWDSPNFKRFAPYELNVSGYAQWRNGAVEHVLVHRLLAVAEYGFDAVAGKHIHHKNGIRWDNRLENLEVLTPSEHAKLHGRGY
jgi:hypothetical protein